MSIFNVIDFKTLVDNLIFGSDFMNHGLNLKFYQQTSKIIEEYSIWVTFFVVK